MLKLLPCKILLGNRNIESRIIYRKEKLRKYRKMNRSILKRKRIQVQMRFRNKNKKNRTKSNKSRMMDKFKRIIKKKKLRMTKPRVNKRLLTVTLNIM